MRCPSLQVHSICHLSHQIFSSSRQWLQPIPSRQDPRDRIDPGTQSAKYPGCCRHRCPRTAEGPGRRLRWPQCVPQACLRPIRRSRLPSRRGRRAIVGERGRSDIIPLDELGRRVLCRCEHTSILEMMEGAIVKALDEQWWCGESNDLAKTLT